MGFSAELALETNQMTDYLCNNCKTGRLFETKQFSDKQKKTTNGDTFACEIPLKTETASLNAQPQHDLYTILFQ